MSNLKFRDEGEHHNFWQNYTDLMSGFLIVFIITSLLAFNHYKGWLDMFQEAGVAKANIKDVVVTAEMYKKINSFEEAVKKLDSKYINYNTKYERFECSVPVQFQPQSDIIPMAPRQKLILAGKELNKILTFSSPEMGKHIGFTIVIEGRAAKSWKSPNPNLNAQHYAEELSYRRARNLFHLWEANGVIDDLERKNCNIYITGSGFGGRGRYGESLKGKVTNWIAEEKNKTFIIQVTPFIKK